jgi:hypothetical protein
MDETIYVIIGGEFKDEVSFITKDKEVCEVLETIGHVYEKWNLISLKDAIKLKALQQSCDEYNLKVDADYAASELING